MSLRSHLFLLIFLWLNSRLGKSSYSNLYSNPNLYTFRKLTAHRYQVFESGNGIYQVEIPDSGQRFIVNLEETKCDCGDFYEYQSPCSHAICAARYEAKDPIALFYHVYATAQLRASYSHPLVPISLYELVPDTTIQPPILKKQASRPRTKRSLEKKANKVLKLLRIGS